jgi:hypothetical protein
MHQLIYPALFCALVLLCTAPAIADTELTKVQPLTAVTKQNTTTDWKQANQKVAELGGWQFYASEAGGHQGMDHSGHTMPMDHSKHRSGKAMDHSGHTMPMDHSKHHKQMDHSQHLTPQPEQTGDEHEHHH